MAWLVEYTDEFGQWWDTLDEEQQEDVAAIVGELENLGPTLPYPYSSDAEGPSTARCGNSEFRAGASRLESFTRSTHGGRLFF